jgi:hypothetical protein
VFAAQLRLEERTLAITKIKNKKIKHFSAMHQYYESNSSFTHYGDSKVTYGRLLSIPPIYQR